MFAWHEPCICTKSELRYRCLSLCLPGMAKVPPVTLVSVGDFIYRQWLGVAMTGRILFVVASHSEHVSLSRAPNVGILFDSRRMARFGRQQICAVIRTAIDRGLRKNCLTRGRRLQSLPASPFAITTGLWHSVYGQS